MKHFIPFEIATLLKQNGFSELCFAKYLEPDTQKELITNNPYQSFDFNNMFVNPGDDKSNILISAPLYGQVIDWFEEKELFLYTLRFDNRWQWKRDLCSSYDDYSRGDGFNTRYEALNDCIINTLNTYKHGIRK